MNKDKIEAILLFIFMLVVTIGFINPFGTYYTWWNALYLINN
jgi:hypothetical protein